MACLRDCDFNSQPGLPLSDESVHDLRLVVDGQHHLVDPGIPQGLDLVHNHRLRCGGRCCSVSAQQTREPRMRFCITLLQNSTSGFGTDSVSGRRRVPKPPTKMSALTILLNLTRSVHAYCVTASGMRATCLQPFRRQLRLVGRG